MAFSTTKRVTNSRCDSPRDGRMRVSMSNMNTHRCWLVYVTLASLRTHAERLQVGKRYTNWERYIHLKFSFSVSINIPGNSLNKRPHVVSSCLHNFIFFTFHYFLLTTKFRPVRNVNVQVSAHPAWHFPHCIIKTNHDHSPLHSSFTIILSSWYSAVKCPYNQL